MYNEPSLNPVAKILFSHLLLSLPKILEVVEMIELQIRIGVKEYSPSTNMSSSCISNSDSNNKEQTLFNANIENGIHR
jgi:hypothetical protein